jgi:predicted lipoprotein with Yx(FWY)xxD motif
MLDSQHGVIPLPCRCEEDPVRSRSRLLPVVAVVALVGAACATEETTADEPGDVVGQDAEAGDDAAAEDDNGATAGEGDTDEDAAGAAAADDDAAGDDPAPDGPAAAATGTLTTGIEVASSDLGEHIVTDDGTTAYAAVDQRDGEVTCVADCAQVWPPLIADGELDVGDGIDAELVTTVALDDGREQVVVAGAPLHTFVVDAAPGDVRGQTSADRWYVVAPTGELVGAADR